VECSEAVARLWDHVEAGLQARRCRMGSGQKVGLQVPLGFDTEWTCHKKHSITHPPTATIQICSGLECFIFHLPKILRNMAQGTAVAEIVQPSGAEDVEIKKYNPKGTSCRGS
jgi:hypothetical protein